MLFLSAKLAGYLTCQFSCFLCSSQHHHNVKCDDNRAQLRELAEARANGAEQLLLFFLRPWKFPNVSFGPYIWKDFLSLGFSPPSSFPCLIHSPLKIPSHSGHGWCEADGFFSVLAPASLQWWLFMGSVGRGGWAKQSDFPHFSGQVSIVEKSRRWSAPLLKARVRPVGRLKLELQVIIKS